ncbi:hypothetical protein DX928_09225 [Bacillus swezeyi]|nr:hypothetical protein DX928_09225 [Bacillus swezeyi]
MQTEAVLFQLLWGTAFPLKIITFAHQHSSCRPGFCSLAAIINESPRLKDMSALSFVQTLKNRYESL